jgi:putative phage-type endonuclease
MIIYDMPQRSDEWHEVRKGKITGTKLGDVFKADNLTLLDKLIAEEISGQSSIYINAAMQRGVDMEPVAKSAYCELNNVEVLDVGFIEHDKYSYLGASPDGLIMSEGKYKGAIEIKVPETATHVKYIRMGKLPIEYKYQVYAMFLINEDLEFLDFISWDDRFVVKPLFVHTTFRTEIAEELIKIESELLKFREKWLKYYREIIF